MFKVRGLLDVNTAPRFSADAAGRPTGRIHQFCSLSSMSPSWSRGRETDPSQIHLRLSRRTQRSAQDRGRSELGDAPLFMLLLDVRIHEYVELPISSIIFETTSQVQCHCRGSFPDVGEKVISRLRGHPGLFGAVGLELAEARDTAQPECLGTF